MATKKQTVRRKIWFLDVSLVPLIVAAIVSTIVIYLVYGQTQDILKQRLRERITSIVRTAVLQINSEDVEHVIRDEARLSEALLPFIESSTQTFDNDSYIEQLKQNHWVWNHPIIRVTDQMKQIRDNNEDLTYIYILEATDIENTTKFVTDSDTAIPVDWDGNGKIDELEYPPLPGEDYDVSDIDVIDEAFNQPIAASDLYTDKWGTFLTGYAPIKNSNGDTVAVLAIDVEIKDFNKLVSATLIPFSVLAVVLLLMLSIQTMALVRIWGNRVEMVKELDRQKDELLSIVSHQLATPVSSVKWYLEMMMDGDIGKLSNDQEKHVGTMQSVVTDLVDLVNMILDVSRIQLGKMKVDRTDLDLNVFFQEIINIIEPKAKERQVELVTKIPKGLPTGNLDKRLMHMTVENLLSNAVKYSKEKAGKVEFVVDVSSGVLHYSVKDNGCGIPKEDQDKIFGKLFRASNVRKVDGNGFGLYVAKGAVEAQGGSVHFESQEHKGTTFYVSLPLKPIRKD